MAQPQSVFDIQRKKVEKCANILELLKVDGHRLG